MLRRHVGVKATRPGPLLRADLRAENKSHRTVETYLEAVRLLEAFLSGRDVGLAEADRAHIEAFLADLLARWKPATAANRYRSLKVFYAWLEDEGEIAADPMAKMRPPAIPEQPIPVLPDDALRRLFAACAGKDFEARRDTAMIMLLLDSGARRAELVGLRVDDLDFEHDVAGVIGKGRRERALPFGRKTAVALDRYLRINDDVGPADEEDALINTKGASLNYVKHAFRTGGAFCADKDSLKGED